MTSNSYKGTLERSNMVKIKKGHYKDSVEKWIYYKLEVNRLSLTFHITSISEYIVRNQL